MNHSANAEPTREEIPLQYLTESVGTAVHRHLLLPTAQREIAASVANFLRDRGVIKNRVIENEQAIQCAMARGAARLGSVSLAWKARASEIPFVQDKDDRALAFSTHWADLKDAAVALHATTNAQVVVAVIPSHPSTASGSVYLCGKGRSFPDNQAAAAKALSALKDALNTEDQSEPDSVSRPHAQRWISSDGRTDIDQREASDDSEAKFPIVHHPSTPRAHTRHPSTSQLVTPKAHRGNPSPASPVPLRSPNPSGILNSSARPLMMRNQPSPSTYSNLYPKLYAPVTPPPFTTSSSTAVSLPNAIPFDDLAMLVEVMDTAGAKTSDTDNLVELIKNRGNSDVVRFLIKFPNLDNTDKEWIMSLFLSSARKNFDSTMLNPSAVPNPPAPVLSDPAEAPAIQVTETTVAAEVEIANVEAPNPPAPVAVPAILPVPRITLTVAPPVTVPRIASAEEGAATEGLPGPPTEGPLGLLPLPGLPLELAPADPENIAKSSLPTSSRSLLRHKTEAKKRQYQHFFDDGIQRIQAIVQAVANSCGKPYIKVERDMFAAMTMPKHKRKASAYAHYISLIISERKEAGDTGSRINRVNVQKEDAVCKEWRKIKKDKDRLEEFAQGATELREKKSTTRKYGHAATLSAIHQADGIQQSMEDLFRRTGIMGFGFLFRSEHCAFQPRFVFSGDNVEVAVRALLHSTGAELAGKLDLWSISGLLARLGDDHALPTLQRKVRIKVNEALCLAVSGGTNTVGIEAFSWTNHHHNTELVYNVQLQGFPLTVMRDPGRMGKAECEAVIAALDGGECFFKKLTPEQTLRYRDEMQAQTQPPKKGRKKRSDAGQKRGPRDQQGNDASQEASTAKTSTKAKSGANKAKATATRTAGKGKGKGVATAKGGGKGKATASAKSKAKAKGKSRKRQVSDDEIEGSDSDSSSEADTDIKYAESSSGSESESDASDDTVEQDITHSVAPPATLIAGNVESNPNTQPSPRTSRKRGLPPDEIPSSTPPSKRAKRGDDNNGTTSTPDTVEPEVQVGRIPLVSLNVPSCF